MIVADTHAWLWWISNRKLLSAAASSALDSDTVAVSPITFWEIAMLARKQRVALDAPERDWLRDAVEESGTVVMDLSLEIAVLAGTWGDVLRGDPADRIIVATARHHGCLLVTKDELIRASQLVPTVW